MPSSLQNGILDDDENDDVYHYADNASDSGSDSVPDSDSDEETLRRACALTGTNPRDLKPNSSCRDVATVSNSSDSESGNSDDLEFLRKVQERFSIEDDALPLKPICSLPPQPLTDDEEDDFQTLRAIKRRFSAYDGNADAKKDSMENSQVDSNDIRLGNGTPNNMFGGNTDASEVVPCSEDVCHTAQTLESQSDRVVVVQPSGCNNQHQLDAHNLFQLPSKHSSFPKSAHLFIEAIKKNRSCQKFLRSKLTQLEARMEENKKLMERVKVLKDFQSYCQKKTQRALSQKKDPRIELISVQKSRTSSSSKVDDKKISPLSYGPVENSHVENYRMALQRFPVSFSCKKWSKVDRENLVKGIKQQFQEMLLQKSWNLCRLCSELPQQHVIIQEQSCLRILEPSKLTTRESMGSSYSYVGSAERHLLLEHERSFEDHIEAFGHGHAAYGIDCFDEDDALSRLSKTISLHIELYKMNGNVIYQAHFNLVLLKRLASCDCDSGVSAGGVDLNKIIASIEAHEITSEEIRLFLPKVNWDQLASKHVPGHSGAECEARWLNFEDPLINQKPWTKAEDMNLLLIVQEKGIDNWMDISVSLGTNRTPFQCLVRYQRSLNASILRSEWTKEEDAQLREAVQTYGESNWQVVASMLEGRTGTQCSNRWNKTLHPSRQRVGRWTSNEDKRLKVAVMLFGPKTWRKIAEFVPGRTGVQCRERWANCLDPSLNMDEWTEEEDSKLKAAISEHGHCWSKVAACVPPRTDNQCRRRWKVLLPHEVPLLQEARKIKKVSFISNFVDRESERPSINIDDLLPLHVIYPVSEPLHHGHQKKRKKIPRCTPEYRESQGAFSSTIPRRARSKRSRRKAEVWSEIDAKLTNDCEIETVPNGSGRMRRRQHKRKGALVEPMRDQTSSCPDSNLLMRSVGEGGVSEATVTKRRKFCEPRVRCSEAVNGSSNDFSTFSENCELPPHTGYSVVADTAEVTKKRKAPTSHLMNKNSLEVESIDDTILLSDLARPSTVCGENLCKRTTKLRSKRKSSTTRVGEESPSLPQGLEVRRSNYSCGVDTGVAASIQVEETASVSLSGFLKRQKETALPPQGLELTVNEDNGLDCVEYMESSRCPEELVGSVLNTGVAPLIQIQEVDEDDVPLASFLKKGKKRSRFRKGGSQPSLA
ncbi:SANT/Myb domain [Dillenia turbinata]|uniref:SANT/Myb domain n=1 Tax=Dillenia turbinata TaxID=194707 RepID=A0AAN8Z1F6_9MAGN